MPSLQYRKSELSNTSYQREIIENPRFSITPFSQKLKSVGLFPLKPKSLRTLQINMGKMCNQACHHCHVDAGPDRREIMTQETMEYCLSALREHKFQTVDLTGGAPEMNPHFRWFVRELSALGVSILVRCNLTIIMANEKYRDLPKFFKEHSVNVVSSLPHFTKSKTDRQRGDGVFEDSIAALKSLNEVGYGVSGTGLDLDLVYNPSGCFLPGEQSLLEREYRLKLKSEFGIDFNNLFCITNMPISRYLEYLLRSENYESYMNTLLNAFNPIAAAGVMCRDILSVSWDGKLFDCDFNQMLDLNLDARAPQHIKDFNIDLIEGRNIIIGQHCYGCTAGSGSSCGGTTV